MKSALYTRTGDTGTTSLVGGERVKKNSVRLEAYGTLDELSATIGAISAVSDCDEETRGQLTAILNEMFNIGSYLATDVKPGETPLCQSLTPEKMAQLEGWIDALDEQTPKVHAFILPAGCHAATRAHIARTVCRRAERRILDLADVSFVDPNVIRYINRLSDYLFIAARHFNFINSITEVVWDQTK